MSKLRLFLIATVATVLMACGSDKDEVVTENDNTPTEQNATATADKADSDKKKEKASAEIAVPKECNALIEKSESMRQKMTEKTRELIEVMPEEQREEAEAELTRQLAMFTMEDAKEELRQDLENRGVDVVAEECAAVSEQLDEVEAQLVEAMDAQKAMFIEMQKAEAEDADQNDDEAESDEE